MSKPALTTQNVTKIYGEHRALNEVSITVEPQRIFGLLGPNGAGKTTLIRIINQITGPDTGNVSFFGESLRPEHVHDIGYLPEERGLYKKMKVGEQCLYLARLKGMSKREAKTKLKTWFERFEIEGWWNKKVEELSKGMAQKMQFITTVLHEPKLLILDEPFSGFDPINVELIRREILRLRDEGATIILSTHNMNSVEELCDDIALLNQSNVVISGGVQELRDQYRNATYRLQFSGNMLAFTNALWTNFELVEKDSEEHDHDVVIRLLNGHSLNDLLNTILPVVAVHGVQEIIPSMNDIFIRAVQESSQPEAAASQSDAP